MKKVKRFISFILCLIMAIGGYSTVYAQDGNIGVTDTPEYIIDDSGISLYSTSLPKETWNLKDKGRYNFSGHTESSTLYTNYLFTGVSKVRISVTNNLDNQEVKVQLKKDKSGINTVVSTNWVAEGQGQNTTWTVSIDSSSEYYLRFPATCSFYGYIEAA